MADREGGMGGYNIPQVDKCPQLEEWLQNPAKLLHEKDRAPDFVKRLISDALLCFYIRERDTWEIWLDFLEMGSDVLSWDFGLVNRLTEDLVLP